MSYRLLVKGAPADLQRAADERGITLHNAARFTDTESTADVDDAFTNRVFSWFCERPEFEPGAGYPAGTLLFYNTSREAS